jgi:hypothetical protein
MVAPGRTGITSGVVENTGDNDSMLVLSQHQREGDYTPGT